MTQDQVPHVAVVGAGIGGLYAAYLLGMAGYQVDVYEMQARPGGRIDTRAYPRPELGEDPFLAEFGPMRFELGLQTRFLRLSRHLGIGFKEFSPTTSPPIPHEYQMTAIEAAFESTLDLHEWAVLKMFFGRVPEVEAALEGIETSVYSATGPQRKVPPDETEQLEEARVIGRLQLQYLQLYSEFGALSEG